MSARAGGGDGTRAGRRLSLGIVLAAVLLVWPLASRGVDLDAAPDPRADERAIGVIRQLQAAQSIYHQGHGYYDRLECLVQDACVPLIPYPPSYLSPDVLRSTAFGYRFRLHDGPRAVAATTGLASSTAMQAYAFTAVPLDPAPDGRSFCGDASGKIYELDGRIQPRIEAGRCLQTARTLPSTSP